MIIYKVQMDIDKEKKDEGQAKWKHHALGVGQQPCVERIWTNLKPSILFSFLIDDMLILRKFPRKKSYNVILWLSFTVELSLVFLSGTSCTIGFCQTLFVPQ